MSRILASDLLGEISGSNILFITFASFEARCLTAVSNLPYEKIGSAVVLFNRANPNPIITENRLAISAKLGDVVKEVAINLNDPFEIRERVENALSNIDRMFDQFVIDITTFTHEALAITVDLLSERWPDNAWTILYNGAGDYDTSHKNVDEVWLSKRPSSVRSVLGFSGEMHPSRKLHLFVLVGFEHERAHYAIEIFEPNRITLAKGKKKDSVTLAHAETNAHFFKKVDAFVKSTAATYSAVKEVVFSPTDSVKTQEIVQQVVSDNAEFNTVICPMNTKLSTLGVILAAMENPSIQLAYVPVDEYNEAAYATPSEWLTIENRLIKKKVSERPLIKKMVVLSNVSVDDITQPSVPSGAHGAGNLPA